MKFMRAGVPHEQGKGVAVLFDCSLQSSMEQVPLLHSHCRN